MCLEEKINAGQSWEGSSRRRTVEVWSLLAFPSASLGAPQTERQAGKVTLPPLRFHGSPDLHIPSEENIPSLGWRFRAVGLASSFLSGGCETSGCLELTGLRVRRLC